MMHSDIALRIHVKGRFRIHFSATVRLVGKGSFSFAPSTNSGNGKDGWVVQFWIGWSEHQFWKIFIRNHCSEFSVLDRDELFSSEIFMSGTGAVGSVRWSEHWLWKVFVGTSCALLLLLLLGRSSLFD
jgi:hypothetical protein